MKISYSKQYLKQFEKLPKQSKQAAINAIAVFVENPNAPELRNHALKGKLTGHRSIDAGFDLRLIFREEGGYVFVTFAMVGTHNQLYG